MSLTTTLLAACTAALLNPDPDQPLRLKLPTLRSALHLTPSERAHLQQELSLLNTSPALRRYAAGSTARAYASGTRAFAEHTHVEQLCQRLGIQLVRVVPWFGAREGRWSLQALYETFGPHHELTLHPDGMYVSTARR